MPAVRTGTKNSCAQLREFATGDDVFETRPKVGIRVGVGNRGCES